MMKNLICAISILALTFTAQGQNEYFFPGASGFDSSIPSPEEFLGYPIGEFHTRHDRMVSYFETLADISDKATIQTIGMTYEHRPQVILTITSEDNHTNLEDLRKQHLTISDPSVPMPNLDETPLVIVMGYSVHGNEPSTSEASMLLAYYLLASTSDEVADYLDKAIIHIEPALNPDGRERHTNWANMHKGNPKVADPIDREHNEVWPGGRVNHYWFDLNRDWLPLTHVESQARIKFYHQWLPNLGADYHEMGTNSTYFFEPTKPFSTENPIVPRTNYKDLNNAMAPYFAKSLDKMGSLYFTKELFDNSYPGYGSTYQDIHGGLGLVFEQASSRGHLQQSSTREVSFAFTIRNHVATSIASIEGTVANKNLFQTHQRDFFQYALNQAAKDPVKVWLFGDEFDRTRNEAFVNLLLQHKIKVYENNTDQSIAGNNYKAGMSYMVPTNQKQHLMVKSVFEHVKSFYDSVFYDASTWTVSSAFGIPNEGLKTTRFTLGDEITGLEKRMTELAKASYAYIIDWRDYNASMALNHLLENDVFVHTAFKPFAVATDNDNKSFGYGSLMISVADQNKNADEVHQLVSDAVSKAGISATPVNTGFSINGIDLGSPNFRTIQQPKALLIVGEGVYLYEAGEVWHLLDSRVGMPITKVDKVDLGRVNLYDYNTLVMVRGNYNDLPEKFVNDVKQWLSAGNTLIAQKQAVNWAISKEVVNEELIKVESGDEPRMDYTSARNYRGSKVIGGSIYEVDLDISHPVGFGYSKRNIPVYRNSNIFLKPSSNPFSTVAQYTRNPWISGYIKPENLDYIKQSASIVVSRVGRGRAVLMTDNSNFRGYWYGTSKLFINALFFGRLINTP
ncbi:MAG: M14 family zinc carboxypeptidase [Bacteroidota bacterium]